MPSKIPTKRPPRVTGLAKFVSEVTPFIDSGSKSMTRRGIFQCEKGHRFTATFAEMKAGEHKLCKQCSQGSASIAALLNAKVKLVSLEKFTAAPSLSMSLVKMVEQQNARLEVVSIGKELERLEPKQIATYSDQLSRKYRDATGNLDKVVNMVLEVLDQVVTLNKAGEDDTARLIMAELALVLLGERE